MTSTAVAFAPAFNFETLLFSLRDSATNASNSLSSLDSRQVSRSFKKFLPFIVLFIIVVLIAILVKNILQGALRSNSSSDVRVQLQGAKAKETLNKSFDFSVKDDKGKEFTKIKYVIDTAELRDQIVVKGQLMTSVKGRTYLILTLDLTNSSDKTISFNSLNYVRLTVNGDENKLIAADIHNDPVLIQAISTKTTRLGFPISDTDKKLVLHVGEVDGPKQSIALKF